MKYSHNRLLCFSFDIMSDHGNLSYSGQSSWVGEPHILNIKSSCSSSCLPGNNALPVSNSANIHLFDIIINIMVIVAITLIFVSKKSKEKQIRMPEI